jgi:hypothetical protein
MHDDTHIAALLVHTVCTWSRILQTSTGSSIASGDGSLAKERWITSSEKTGIKKTVRCSPLPLQVVSF